MTILRGGVDLLSRLFSRLITWLVVLAGLLLLFICFSICYSIFTRSLGLPSPVWILQFNEYALLWITFLGTAWALDRGKHVSVDLLTVRMGERTKTYFNLAHGIMGIAVCTVLLWYGSVTTWGHFQNGITDVKAVDVPKYLILIVIPIGFLTLSFQFLKQFFSTWKELRKKPTLENLENEKSLLTDQDAE